MQIDNLSKELDLLFEKEIVSINNDLQVKLYFYRYCQILCQTPKDANILKDLKAKLFNIYLEESQWIYDFWIDTFSIDYNEFIKHLPEVQSMVLDKLFRKGFYPCIINLFKACNKMEIDAIIFEQLSFYCSLSYFNINDYANAIVIIEGLNNHSKQDNYNFFYHIINLHNINKNYIEGKDEQKLKDQLFALEAMKDTLIYISNYELVANTIMITCLNICRSNKAFFEVADDYYARWTEDIQNSSTVIYYYGMCLELSERIDQAISLYKSVDWKKNTIIAHRLMLSYIQLDKSEETLLIYDQLDCRNEAAIDGVYLYAIYKTNDDDTYIKELSEKVSIYRSSLLDLFYICLYIEDKSIFINGLVAPIEDIIIKNRDVLISLDTAIKIGYASILANFQCVDLLKIILDSIESLSLLSDSEVHIIYKAIFNLINEDNTESQFEVSEEINDADKIIDRFLFEDVHREWFLQLKIHCSRVLSKPFSTLKYSKELYEYKPDLDTASNILGILLQQGKKDIAEYAPYINEIRNSNVPRHLMNAAFVLQQLGQSEEADFLAYKALYILNGKYDYDILGNYCIYTFRNIQPETIPLKKSKSVVTLLSNDVENEEKRVLCIDEEAELFDEDNKSLGIEHIHRRNKNYLKIISASVGQKIIINGKGYIVKEFVPRSTYAFRYVLDIIQNNKDVFSNKSIWTISGSNPNEMMEQFKCLSSQNDNNQKIIDYYISINEGIGVPIDSIVNGDYSRYLVAMKYLLYTEDLAYYAGEPRIDEKLDDYYVITISSLMLIAMFGWLNYLLRFKDRIICPSTYYDFFHSLYERETRIQQISPGKLFALDDGQVTMVENDKDLPSFWETLRDTCQEFKQVSITDDERIEYDLFDNLKGESFFSRLNIDMIQLDSLIVAEKTNSTYICDDLFFRKISTNKNIQNINVIALLVYNIEKDKSLDIIKTLSKTNYIYIPFIHFSTDEDAEIIENLLKGKIKEEIYGDFFNRYYSFANAFIKGLYELSEKADYD